MNKIILNLAIATLWCLMLSHTAHAQINRYFPGTWKDAPKPTPITDTSLFSDDYTIMDYKVAINFDLTPAELTNDVTHARYQYRRIRINTARGADSMRSIVTEMNINESINYMRGRIIKPDGKVEELDGQLEYQQEENDTRGILNIERIPPGSELEYETRIYVSRAFAGTETFQCDYPLLHTAFKLVAPKKYAFYTKSHNGFPETQATPEAAKNIYLAEVDNMPALKRFPFFYYEPHLQAIEFSLKNFVEEIDRKKKDTLTYGWQQYGEEQFMRYFYLSKPEFTRLQKEMSTWAFLKQQKPLPLLIYQVEHYIKSKYHLTSYEEPASLADINNIIKTKQANETGYIKMLAGVFYIMGIRCQLMLTNDRGQLPLDSNIARFTDAKNVLLYFPDINQVIAPTAGTYQTPYYPPMWANIPALVCADTLINNLSKITTSFRNTPLPDYTTSGLRNETELWLTDTPGMARLYTTQQFSGFADAQLKTALKGLNGEFERTFASFILLRPDVKNISSVVPTNIEWSPTAMNQPFTLKSNYTIPALWLNNGANTIVKTGGLLAWQYQSTAMLPPSEVPIEMGYPCYFEKRVIVHLPPGYKVKNSNDFNIDLSNLDPNVGLRCIYRQEGNTVNIFMMEWYKQITHAGNSRKAFDKVANAVRSFHVKDLVLEKE